ncbi:MAG: hypothetical protein KAJ75_00110 [Alphaproteobacteria bacterium]|nr:hypothetical protein [Alphaproteobacteria bacterium]
MGTSYDAKIKVAEAESKLGGQQLTAKRIGIEIMKYKRKIEDYESNLKGLNAEIEISKQELEKLRGGE